MPTAWLPHILRFVCILSWFLFGLVIVFIAPEDLGAVGIILFLIVFGAAIFSLGLFGLYYIRVVYLKRRPVFVEFHHIFRESALFTAGAVIWLLLARYNRLTWLNLILMLLALLLIEIFFLVYDQKPHQKA